MTKQTMLEKCTAPAGMWRVVETDGWHGPLHAVIGDFLNFSEAADRVYQCHAPYSRVLYNDEGVQVLAVTPGSEGQADAGPES
ncbi:MAG: hypothetical protein IT405_00945 [Candidatus Yanofskybacteria bacterium]|nr:hypothetical protein [Candidatus Yanofskybacteria bacterium]